MSRKGNSMDNGMMENFFGLLEIEMYYNQEDNYKTINQKLFINCPTFGGQFKMCNSLFSLLIIVNMKYMIRIKF